MTAATDDESFPIFDVNKANEFFNILLDTGKNFTEVASKKKKQIGESVQNIDTSAMKENLFKRTSTIAEKSLEFGVETYLVASDKITSTVEEQSLRINKIQEETSKGIMKVKTNTNETI